MKVMFLLARLEMSGPITYDEFLMKFSIETVAKMTGIAASSLRNWEKRYGFPQPTRTEGGHRFYCTQDIDFLKRASSWIEEGYNLGHIGELYQKEVHERSSKTQPQMAEVYSKSSPQVQQIFDDVDFRVELIYQALLKYELQSIQQHYCILNAKLSPEQLFDRVFEPILRRVGADWALGKVSVAQEHFVSGFLRLKVASLLAIEFPATRGQTIFAATLTDERHEGGLLLLAAHLKFRGYPVFYFGTDLPLADLRAICDEAKPTVLALSYLWAENLRRDLTALGGLGLPVVVGGMAVLDPLQLAIFRDQAPANVHFCDKKVGSEAAHFIEMISQAKV